jgi:fructose-1-phosphate kinase PfkB-like protein
LDKAQVVVLSGRSIPGAPVSLYPDLIRIAHRKKVKSVFDTSGKDYRAGLRQKPWMIKPNIEEAEEALTMSVRSVNEIKEATARLYSKGISMIAVTCGSRGAYVYNGQTLLYVKPPRLQRKNPVGCGDSFIAGFLTAHIKQRSFMACSAYAVACGSANAMSIDPGDVQKKTINSIYKRIQIKQIV